MHLSTLVWGVGSDGIDRALGSAEFTFSLKSMPSAPTTRRHRCRREVYDGVNPLHIASHYGHVEMVRFLREAGADENQAAHDVWKPLTIASQQGHVEVVRFLCEAGADKNQALEDGYTPLHIAS